MCAGRAATGNNLSVRVAVRGFVAHTAGGAGDRFGGIPGARAQANRALHGGGALLSHCQLGAGVPPLGAFTQAGVVQRLCRCPSSSLHPAGWLPVKCSRRLTNSCMGFLWNGGPQGIGVGAWDVENEYCTLRSLIHVCECAFHSTSKPSSFCTMLHHQGMLSVLSTDASIARFSANAIEVVDAILVKCDTVRMRACACVRNCHMF